jgi:hypothetical protein
MHVPLLDRRGHYLSRAVIRVQCLMSAMSRKHAYPLNYGAIERYVNAHKEMGHDANDAGRSVA